MKKWLMILILTLSISNVFGAEKTLKIVPKKYQKYYYIVAVSEDRGDSVQNVDRSLFCFINGNMITNYEKKSFRINKVTQLIENETIFTCLYLTNGYVWVLSDPKLKGTVMIQTMNDDGNEIIRALFEVE
jgi:hypothetical protein